jgi:hypothetical protein
MISNNYYNKRVTKARADSEPPEWIGVIKEYTELSNRAEETITNEQNGLRIHMALSTGILALLMERIRELDANPKSGIIRFPKIFKRLCESFQIQKEYVWQLLYCLRDLGYLEIVPFQGVRIKNDKSPQKLRRI